MKVGNIEVEQKLGSVSLEDIIIETSEIAPKGSKMADLIPKMRGESIFHQNRLIELGVKSKINLKDFLSLEELAKIDPKIQALLNDYNFYKVTLVADFAPMPGLKFKYGMVHLDFRGSPDPRPIIYSIAPLNIKDSVKRTTRFGVAPDLKFINIKPGINYLSESSYIEMHPRIIGHYSSESWARWEYRTTDTINEIVGTQIMEVIVQQPVGQVSNALVELEGELNWANIMGRVKGFIFNGELKPQKPTSEFESFTIP